MQNSNRPAKESGEGPQMALTDTVPDAGAVSQARLERPRARLGHAAAGGFLCRTRALRVRLDQRLQRQLRLLQFCARHLVEGSLGVRRAQGRASGHRHPVPSGHSLSHPYGRRTDPAPKPHRDHRLCLRQGHEGHDGEQWRFAQTAQVARIRCRRIVELRHLHRRGLGGAAREQPRPARRLRQDPGGQQGDRRARLDCNRLGDA